MVRALGADGPRKGEGDVRELVLKIEGMTCGHCVHTVTKALSELDGVEDVHVELEGGRAEVAFDPARVDVEAMRRAVEAAGYTLVAAEPADR